MANDIVHEGAPAPDFTLASNRGDIALASLRGSVVVLYFYPRDNTPGCTTEACDFRDELASLAGAGAVVLGVSPDSVKTHTGFAAKFALEFALLADTEHAVAEAYGVWRDKTMYGRTSKGIVRSTFVIDREGVVRRVFDGVKVRRKVGGVERRHVDDVAEAIAALGT